VIDLRTEQELKPRPGPVAVARGKRFTIAPTTQTVSAWATAIGGSPTIKNIDMINRSPGWLQVDLGA
jgi:hypothetical protein